MLRLTFTTLNALAKLSELRTLLRMGGEVFVDRTFAADVAKFVTPDANVSKASLDEHIERLRALADLGSVVVSGDSALRELPDVCPMSVPSWAGTALRVWDTFPVEISRWARDRLIQFAPTVADPLTQDVDVPFADSSVVVTGQPVTVTEETTGQRRSLQTFFCCCGACLHP